MKLADEVEELFIKNFAEDNRRKAMKYLRPSQRKESHAVTFFIGELVLAKNLVFFIFHLLQCLLHLLVNHFGGDLRARPTPDAREGGHLDRQRRHRRLPDPRAPGRTTQGQRALIPAHGAPGGIELLSRARRRPSGLRLRLRQG